MKRSRGFTLFELVVVAVVVMVLAAALFARIPYYQEQAEKVAMENVAGALQSALVMRHSALQARGGSAMDMSILATDNPMSWLQKLPENYAGEYYDPTPQTVAPGRWMFDLKSRELIYVVDRSEHFTPGRDGNNWIRFRIRVQYEPRLGDAASGGKEMTALLLEPSEPYRWFN